MTNSLWKMIFKPLLVASAVALPCLSHASGNTCVYVLGTVEGRVVTTPSIMVVVPETLVTLGPLRVHVDGTEQNIVGYTLATPELDLGTPEKSLFVPAVEEEVPSYSLTIHDIDVENESCVSFGITTPAVPVHVPASALTVPGAVIETPEVTVHTLGGSKTVPGQVITVDGKTIVVPGIDTVVPSLTAGTPDKTIAVDINGALHSASIMDVK